MKTGRNIIELAQEIQRQAETKRDFVADTRKINLTIDEDLNELAEHPDRKPPVRMKLENGNGGHLLGMNPLAHRQLGEHVEIPARYYGRMLTEAPALLVNNVNTWLHRSPSKRMIRTLDGNARAFVSDRFRALDNWDLAEVAFPVLKDAGVKVVSCELTETRLYIKAVDERVVREIGTSRQVDGSLVKYDEVCPSVCLSNSEVGMGALNIETGMFTHRCKNMAIFRESSMKKYHVGGRQELSDEINAMLSDNTKQLTDKATWNQVRDVLIGAFNEARFTAQIADMRKMADEKITGDVPEVVEVTARRFNLNEDERKSVLTHLIEGGDLSRYGLFNALTRTAEDVVSYDRATDFERMGGQLIELPANDWRVIAEAA